MPDPTKTKEHDELYFKNKGKQVHKISKNNNIKLFAVEHLNLLIHNAMKKS